MIRTIYYIIPSDNRELQRVLSIYPCVPNYIIPSDNRELQLTEWAFKNGIDYIIPSDNRELQLQWCTMG